MWKVGYCLVGLVLAITVVNAGAEEGTIPSHPALRDRFYLGFGGFVPQTTTQAQLNSTRLGAGANIDLEQSLDMDRQKTIPVLFGRFRISDRWRIEAEYFRLNRSGERTIDRDIQFGDTVFPANAQVSSKFNFSDTRMSVGYSFFKTTDKELGVGLGFHVAAYDISLSGNGTTTESRKVTAPLPVASVYGQFALTERWAVAGRLDRLSLSYDHYDGNVSGLALDLMYQPFRHVGFGLGYRSLFLSVTSTGSERTAQFRQTFQGPLLFMNASF
jgi:hypothetical protein